MLGKWGPRATLLVAATLLGAVLYACAHNVPQDLHSGEDGKTKGARPITLENGEGKAKGIVTYPGGDRIDWKLVEVPDGKRGTLDFKLTWVPPRPGLQLAFDVFDEWYTPLVVSKASGKKRRGHTRDAQLEGAKGKYYIRVYAVGRGDAGTYKLTVNFTEAVVGPIYDPAKLDIPDPPRLAALPEVVEECTEFNFDPKNKQCQAICPAAGAPPGWPACAGKCPTPPDVNVPSCWATMPCPRPPDKRVRACKNSDWPPCPDKNNPDPENPNCPVNRDPVLGRIVKNEVVGGETEITVGVGADQGIKDKGWTAKVLRGSSGEAPLAGGDVTIIRVAKATTLGKVKLSPDQIQQNDRVKFYPPPR